MTEFSLRMIPDVGFDLIPVSFIIPDFFAGGTDGQQAAQRLHFGEGFLQFFDQLLAAIQTLANSNEADSSDPS